MKIEIREFAAGVTFFASAFSLSSVSRVDQINATVAQTEVEPIITEYRETRHTDEPFVPMPLFVGGVAACSLLTITLCELYRRSDH